ncbi:MAG: hypothetical protein ACI4XW_05515 [Candidatus Spyradocola sp.]
MYPNRRHTSDRAGGGRLRALVLGLSLLLLLTASVGGTLAFLTTQTAPVVNTFHPSQVSCEVTEQFDGTVKSNVSVRNTGDTPAFLRVRLVAYRVNAQGQRIGGTAQIPAFTPGENWFKIEDCYYYALPVAPGESPATPLIGAEGIRLTDYTDADGGRQVVEVIAEAIQSEPASAVQQAWGVTIREGSVTAPAGA